MRSPPRPRRRDDLDPPPKLDPAVWAQGAETVTSAAKFLKCSRKHLFDLMKQKVLPWGRVGRERRIPRGALINLLSGHANYRAGESTFSSVDRSST